MSKKSTILPLDACLDGIRRYTVSGSVSLLLLGWYLSHAQQHYALPPSQRGQGRKSPENVAADSLELGFESWLKTEGGVAERTARNYITAAKNAGLTLEMSEEEALAAAQSALEKYASEKGWTFSSLYKLDAPKPDRTPTAKEIPLGQQWFVFADYVAELCQDESDALKELVQLPQHKLNELEHTTRLALDKIKAAKAARKGVA